MDELCHQTTAYLLHCRELLGQAESSSDEESFSAASDQFSGEASSSNDLPRCPHCDEPALRLLHETPKPSWFALLDHLDPRCPHWYAELDLEEHRRYLMEEHGVDYEDWYRETQVESAMKRAGPSPLIQLHLPGLSPARDFQLESF